MTTEVKSARAVAKQVRIAPRKARLVIDLIRGKDVGEATAILRHTNRAAAPIIEKVLQSAIANAEHNYEMDPDNLVISEAYVDEGITLKRYRPRAQGRASAINKRTSHITVVVSEKKEG
ncbi:MAG TPA: 50S ribosomal protein L22 [Pseudogracilibacillus sp.]|nr:50S ribosomal protein L22 [Pseudogracilibacillus sp.]